MYLGFVNWIVDNYGLVGYVSAKGSLTFFSGIVVGGMLMMFQSAFVMKDVKPNEKLTKVSLLIVDGQIFTSPPKTLFESIEKRFFIFLYKIGLFRKTIEFHNEKRMRILFVTYLFITIVVAIIGLYLSFSMHVLDEKLIDNKQEHYFIHELNKVTQED